MDSAQGFAEPRNKGVTATREQTITKTVVFIITSSFHIWVPCESQRLLFQPHRLKICLTETTRGHTHVAIMLFV